VSNRQNEHKKSSSLPSGRTDHPKTCSLENKVCVMELAGISVPPTQDESGLAEDNPAQRSPSRFGLSGQRPSTQDHKTGVQSSPTESKDYNQHHLLADPEPPPERKRCKMFFPMPVEATP
jgi:hypothetical protein